MRIKANSILLLITFISFISYSYAHKIVIPENKESQRKENLKLILKVLPPDQLNENRAFDDRGRVSFYDRTFTDWLERTGELPPEFATMPSLPFLPDPLIIDEGKQNIPVSTTQQWQQKREWMKKQLQHYITGTFPPAPDNMKVKILEEKMDGKVLLQLVELAFGPENRAKLTLELIIPPGKGPFPVFLTQWNHREWAQVAVRRGYIGCIYAGADAKDDTEKYAEIWAGKYDFTRLMRRAWGASRAIDYLYTLDAVEKEKIALTGHSRNGKTSLMAAAFDERIAACIPSSGASGAELPWRYTSHNFDVEDIALLSSARPSWLHPRLRFFIGREHKLPVDQNSFMALIAPRGLMPVDFNEIMACIAPRPVLIISPEEDRYAHLEDIKNSIDMSSKIYKLYQASKNMQLSIPYDINRFSPEMQETMYHWLETKYK